MLHFVAFSTARCIPPRRRIAPTLVWPLLVHPEQRRWLVVPALRRLVLGQQPRPGRPRLLLLGLPGRLCCRQRIGRHSGVGICGSGSGSSDSIDSPLLPPLPRLLLWLWQWQELLLLLHLLLHLLLRLLCILLLLGCWSLEEGLERGLLLALPLPHCAGRCCRGLAAALAAAAADLAACQRTRSGPCCTHKPCCWASLLLLLLCRLRPRRWRPLAAGTAGPRWRQPSVQLVLLCCKSEAHGRRRCCKHEMQAE